MAVSRAMRERLFVASTRDAVLASNKSEMITLRDRHIKPTKVITVVEYKRVGEMLARRQLLPFILFVIFWFLISIKLIIIVDTKLLKSNK